jgi:hypothetical protein
MPFQYRGDRAQPYDHTTGQGLVGKVVGPNVDGQYMVCTDAHYDPATDKTTAQFQAIVHPETALRDAL